MQVAAAVLFTLVLCWLAFGLYGRHLRAPRKPQAQAELTPEALRARWLYWWIRNAAEMTPLDATRPHLMRLAIAAVLAPDLATFARDLHRVATDSATSGEVRGAALSFLHDLEGAEQAKEYPWAIFARLNPGQPEHNAGAIGLSYRCALQSWLALFTRSLEERVPGGSNSLPPDPSR